MAATTPQALFAEAGCFCAVTSQAYETMKLALLSNIITSLGVTMTIPELLDYGKCYGCLGLTTAQTVELALLDLVSANVSGGGGGGGATEVYFGTGDPNGVQTATRPAIFYDADGAIWIKTSAGSSDTGWEQRL